MHTCLKESKRDVILYAVFASLEGGPTSYVESTPPNAHEYVQPCPAHANVCSIHVRILKNAMLFAFTKQTITTSPDTCSEYALRT
jgi:hypothetical protein